MTKTRPSGKPDKRASRTNDDDRKTKSKKNKQKTNSTSSSASLPPPSASPPNECSRKRKSSAIEKTHKKRKSKSNRQVESNPPPVPRGRSLNRTQQNHTSRHFQQGLGVNESSGKVQFNLGSDFSLQKSRSNSTTRTVSTRGSSVVTNYSATSSPTGKPRSTSITSRMSSWRRSNSEPAPEPSEEDKLIMALAWRSYHLPGNGVCADWIQFFRNTHPLFGICCHHPLHPVRWSMRMLHLVGSVVFGLLITNLIWLYMIYDDQLDADRSVVTISIGGPNQTSIPGFREANDIANITSTDSEGTNIDITEGMIVLWTFGGCVHSFFDLTVWYVTACVCCLKGRQSLEALAGVRRFGVLFVVFALVGIGAFASFLVVLRASLAESGKDDFDETGVNPYNDEDGVNIPEYDDRSSFHFLLTYVVEVTLALLVYYPLSGTMLFSGFLGCGSIPILGGRPYEILCEHKKAARTVKDVERQNSQLRSTPSEISTIPSSSFGGASSGSQHTRRARKPSRKLLNEVTQQTNFLSSLPPLDLAEPVIDLERGESSVEMPEGEPEPLAASKRSSSKSKRSSSRKKGSRAENRTASVEKAEQKADVKRSSSRSPIASAQSKDSLVNNRQNKSNEERSERSSSGKRGTSKSKEIEQPNTEKSSSKSKRSSSRRRSSKTKKNPVPTLESGQLNVEEPEKSGGPKAREESSDRKLLEP